jgi:aminoglycoside N3'-acetyltransferase
MAGMHRRSTLIAQLRDLGLHAGDLLMVHAALRTVGPVFGGPDALIDALRAAVGPAGTVAAYLDWDAPWEDEVDADGRTEWRWIVEYDTSEPVSERLPETFIEEIVMAYAAGGGGRRGPVGDASCLLVEAADILPFAVRWIEARAG